jgi:hypothetical protein
MAQYIDGIVDFIQFQCKKERGGFLSPEEVVNAINRASMDLFKEKFGLPEEYQPGRPVPKTPYEITQKLTDDMRVFKKDASLVPSSGSVTLPTDYVHVSKIGYQPADATKEEVGFELVDDAQWHSRINRKTAAPSADYPVCNIKATTIEIRPKTLSNVKLTYLKLPTTAVWGYTLVSGRPVYADTGGLNGDSVDLDWPPDTHNDIITRACSILGLHILDGDLIRASEIKKEKGK